MTRDDEFKRILLDIYAAPVINPALEMEKHAAELGVTMSEYKKLLGKPSGSTKEGVMTIGKTEVSSFILDEYEDMEKSETPFVLAEDHEEFMQTKVLPALLEVVEAYRLTKEEVMEESTSAMDTQVGGEHYKTKGLQPLEAVYMNYGIAGLEAAVFTKVNKYFRDKSGRGETGLEKKLEDCMKAQHVLQIFQEKLEAEFAKEKFEESYNRNR